METAIAALKEKHEEQEFLRITATAVKIIQNIQNEPIEDKYRRLRDSSVVRTSIYHNLMHVYKKPEEFHRINCVVVFNRFISHFPRPTCNFIP